MHCVVNIWYSTTGSRIHHHKMCFSCSNLMYYIIYMYYIHALNIENITHVVLKRESVKTI